MARRNDETKESPTPEERSATEAREGTAPMRLDASEEQTPESAEGMKKVRASRAGEFPGVFQVEPGAGPHEALVHIDIPNAPYVAGEKPTMGRVVSLSVTLAHDFRRLGDRYYCIDCEAPAEETRH
jgi:hypothetical protein